MNLLKRKWINLKKLSVSYKNGEMTIENKDNCHKLLVYPRVFKNKKNISITACGKVLEGTGCTIKIIDRHRNILGQCGINSKYLNKIESNRYYLIVLYVPAKSKIVLNELTYEKTDKEIDVVENITADTLLIAPRISFIRKQI